MSISGISSAASATFQSLKTAVSQDISTIGSSLQSGDLSGAQHAYSDIVQLTHGGNATQANAAQANSTPAAPSGGSGFFGSLVQLGLSLLK